MDKKTIKEWANMENRFGFTSFIDDSEKMDATYNKIMMEDSDYFVDEMDHFVIATCRELGLKKELEIIKLKKKIRKLECKISNAKF